MHRLGGLISGAPRQKSWERLLNRRRVSRNSTNAGTLVSRMRRTTRKGTWRARPWSRGECSGSSNETEGLVALLERPGLCEGWHRGGGGNEAGRNGRSAAQPRRRSVAGSSNSPEQATVEKCMDSIFQHPVSRKWRRTHASAAPSRLHCNTDPRRCNAARAATPRLPWSRPSDPPPSGPRNQSAASVAAPRRTVLLALASLPLQTSSSARSPIARVTQPRTSTEYAVDCYRPAWKSRLRAVHAEYERPRWVEPPIHPLAIVSAHVSSIWPLSLSRFICRTCVGFRMPMSGRCDRTAIGRLGK
jgi:hypothetical protein